MMKVGADYYQYTHDHLYSPVALVNLTGSTVLERYEYDAYGNPYILEPNFADDPDGQSDYGNPYLFTGRRVDFLDDGNLILQYNRHRYYDYYMGRWFTQDPMGINPAGAANVFAIGYQYKAGMNLYDYVGARPGQRSDPLGLYAAPWMFPPYVPMVTKCAGIARRRKSNVHAGHEWIEWASESWGFYPGGVQSPDFAAGTNTDIWEWDLYKINLGRLKYGTKKGCPCACVSCAHAKSCIAGYADVAASIDYYIFYVYGWNPFAHYTCRTFVRRALANCCLVRGTVVSK
jgi:RHS repeat-associated protein